MGGSAAELRVWSLAANLLGGASVVTARSCAKSRVRMFLANGAAPVREVGSGASSRKEFVLQNAE